MFFTYINLPNIVTFGFVPLNEQRIHNYIKGLRKAYDKEISLGNHSDSRLQNLNRGVDYLKYIDTPIPIQELDYLLPLTTEVNGKRVTTGIRNIYGSPSWLNGNTVSHPKYKNHGAKALLETMINHANEIPEYRHEISGATDSLTRLYKKLGKNYKIPNNLDIY